MQPDYCPVDYSCVSVEYQDLQSGETEPISCATLNMDLDFDGGADDGKFSFAPTLSDFENNVYPPGDYIITIQGKSRHDQHANADIVTITVTLTLEDPC